MKNSYSGEEIYKSIYFEVGDFGSKISLFKGNVTTYVGLPEKAKEEILSNANKMIDIIKSQDKKFFDRFKEDMLSKNHMQIQHALQSGAIGIKENIQLLFPEIKNQLNQIDKNVKSGELKLHSREQLKDYLNKLDNDTLLNYKTSVKYPELLAKNMISSGQTEESVAAASVVWAVAAAVYFAVAAHNTIAVTALIYYKAAFWGPSIDDEEQAAHEPSSAFETISENDLLKAEMLIDEIASL